MNRQKRAISLITLVITIIVMVILGSAIIITLANNGIIGKAREGVLKQDLASIKSVVSIKEAEILAARAEDKKSMEISAEAVLTACGITTPQVVTIDDNTKYLSTDSTTPKAPCYKLDLEVMDIKAKNGKATIKDGVISDVFVIDANRNIYYIYEGTVIEEETDAAYEALLTYLYGPKGADGKRPGKDAMTLIDSDSTGQDGSFEFLNVPAEVGEIKGLSLEEVSATEYIATISQKTDKYMKVHRLKLTMSNQTILTDPDFGLQLVETYSYANDEAILKYILGEVDTTTGARPGKNLFTIIDPSSGDSDGNFSYINVPNELGSIESRSLELSSDTELVFTFVQTIDNKMYLYKYKAVLDAATEQAITSPEYGVLCLGELEYSRIGMKIKYANMNWTVLYDDNEHGLQMVLDTAFAIDAEAYAEACGIDLTTMAPDLNQNGTIENIELGIGVYNNATKIHNIFVNQLSLDRTFIAKNSNGYMMRTLGTNPSISSFGEDVYNTVVVSESTFPGYGTSSTWFEDTLNLEKKSDGTGYKIKGTDIDFNLKTSAGVTFADSEAIDDLVIYTGKSTYADLKNNITTRTLTPDFSSTNKNIHGTCDESSNMFYVYQNGTTNGWASSINGSIVLLMDKTKFDEFEEMAKSTGNYGNGTEASPWDLDTRSKEISLPSDGKIEYNKYYQGTLAGQYADFRVIFFENGITHIHMKNGLGGYQAATSFISTSRTIDDNNRILCKLDASMGSTGYETDLIFSVQNGCITSFAIRTIENAVVASANLTNNGFDYTAKDPTGTIYVNMPYVAEDGSIAYFFDTNVYGIGASFKIGAMGYNGYIVDTANSQITGQYSADSLRMSITNDGKTLSGKYTVDPNFRWETAVVN